MSTSTSATSTPETVKDRVEAQSFAETAMRLSGKTEEEARRMGAVDKADEQVEDLFAPKFQTVNSPVHKAIWEGKTPIELFQAPLPTGSHPCDEVMEKSLEVVRRHKHDGTLIDDKHKISDRTLKELAGAGFWGLLIDKQHGGSGAPFNRFAPFLGRVAMLDSIVAGLASVHGCIGAVDPVRTFGTPEQKEYFLPKLASGDMLSGFALTEPNAGSDLTALRTTATDAGDDLLINGEKLFITNAVPGRTVGVVCLYQGKPAVVIAELPAVESENFQIVPYGLYALRHAYNQGMRFKDFRVPRTNLLKPNRGDGLTIAYHGLNLGRVSLCAAASGSMRVMLANMLPWAAFRRTYGQAINTRELVKRRISRIAALITGADALVAWTSWLLEEGYRGEIECIVAKIFGSESLKEAAIELFMKTHGGRSFLKGHPFGDNVHDYLAPCIYEGEGEMLGMALFKSVVKEHGKQFFEPIGKALQKYKMKTLNPANPLHAWRLRKELSAYAKWSVGQRFVGRDRHQLAGMDARLSEHVQFALDQFQKCPKEISGAMVKHQLKLADRQCRMSELSARIQDTVVMLVTALFAHQKKDMVTTAAADILCQDLRRKLTGRRPDDAYFRACSQLADTSIGGGYAAIAGIAAEEVLMRYEP
ncbi:MAG TPA: acyl-CoA dehydrogenase family protein [Gemmatales bacterium]|nr:acyl-CoA dehydrogenase family protein [Gemmatales bacterium]